MRLKRKKFFNQKFFELKVYQAKNDFQDTILKSEKKGAKFLFRYVRTNHNVFSRASNPSSLQKTFCIW